MKNELSLLRERELHLTAQVTALSACVSGLLLANPLVCQTLRASKESMAGALLASASLDDHARELAMNYLEDLLP